VRTAGITPNDPPSVNARFAMCGGSGSDWAVKSGHLKGTMQPRQLEHFWNAEPGQLQEE